MTDFQKYTTRDINFCGIDLVSRYGRRAEIGGE